MNQSRCIGIILCLTACFSAAPALAADTIKKEEFLKVVRQMMVRPCTVPAYMKCLGKDAGFCQNSVQAGSGVCEGKVKLPAEISRKDIASIMTEYGACMTGEIKQRLKLDDQKMQHCEDSLRKAFEAEKKKTGKK
ncbi:MAG: hypothetical protein OEZ39_01820 [Gammaproteobacteria bacterium]|nr:hypothetical protein [Gammaproteobacteria bacterium]MDH5650591.1 hypothetical protein [Gammaproteobacteria bacterium]